MYYSDEYTLITICIDPKEDINNLRCLKDIKKNVEDLYMEPNLLASLKFAKNEIKKKIKHIPPNGLIIHTGIGIQKKINVYFRVVPIEPETPVERNFFAINDRFYFTKYLGYS